MEQGAHNAHSPYKYTQQENFNQKYRFSNLEIIQSHDVNNVYISTVCDRNSTHTLIIVEYYITIITNYYYFEPISSNRTSACTWTDPFKFVQENCDWEPPWYTLFAPSLYIILCSTPTSLSRIIRDSDPHHRRYHDS